MILTVSHTHPCCALAGCWETVQKVHGEPEQDHEDLAPSGGRQYVQVHSSTKTGNRDLF